MKNTKYCITAFLAALIIVVGISIPAAYAADITDEAVLSVISQLEAIDTLQEMQTARSDYSSAAEYEEYISKMFAARLAAQEAYDALTAEQKAQIDSTLAEKLENTLDTLFYAPTVSITPRTDEYRYEVIFGNRIMYEIGHHVAAEMPCTIILVDSADSDGSWTPDGLYEYGKSNYEVTYCCDAVAPVVSGTHYKRLNLEDSGYYGAYAAEHIRAIVESSYPFITLDEMKAELKAGGLSSTFVDSLTRGDIISAVQMAIWAYSNSSEVGMSEYAGTIEMTNNTIFRNPIHDYTNEIWSWWDTTNSAPGIYDAQAAYRVNTLVYYLCNLQGMEADSGQLVISDVKITRAELLADSDGTYDVGLYVYLNDSGSSSDDLTLTVTSYSENADGTISVSGSTSLRIGDSAEYGLFVNAKSGDTISVVVEGTQQLDKGVYFYEPEGGMEASQCLVGMAEGETAIRVEESFVFGSDIEKGLRIYKTDINTGLPLSNLTFTVYSVNAEDVDSLSAIPTEEEIAKYAVEENSLGSITTDATGYASITLEDGTYLVVEEHNPEIVTAPVDPFYISVPMTASSSGGEDGAAQEAESINVISVYPKNEAVVLPDTPPVLPPVPDNVTGVFSVLKFDEDDESLCLEGAQFQVYRPATEDDAETTLIMCDGVAYAVVPVTVDDSPLILTTDEDGIATSPEMTCGTYFILEIKAPDGYNLREDAISVTVIPDVTGTTDTIAVPNRLGSVLPETGGIGTAWFLRIGAILAVAAVILLVTQKRMREYK